MKTSLVTAGDAPIPAAIPAFQRPWTPRIAYRLSEQLQDRRHGRRDRAHLAALGATPGTAYPEHATPWLHVLSQACAGHLATEHRDTRALIAVLDHELVEASAAVDRSADDLELARERLTAIEAEAPAVDPRQAAADGERVARARADRALAARTAATAAEVQSLAERHAAAEVRVATLLEDRGAHWELLQRRAAVVLAHFDTRAATYADAAVRGRRHATFTPSVERPSWVAAPAPPIPGSVGADGVTTVP